MQYFNSYSEYLKSDVWKDLRRKRLNIDNYRCARCGTGKNLEVHHIKYPKVLGTEPIDDLVTLCQSCHKATHMFDTKKQTWGEPKLWREGRSNYLEWVSIAKWKDFIYGGKENMCRLDLLKRSAEDYKKTTGRSVPYGPSRIQGLLGLAHLYVVQELLKRGFTMYDLYLRTPLDKPTVLRYAQKTYTLDESHTLQRLPDIPLDELLRASGNYIKHFDE